MKDTQNIDLESKNPISYLFFHYMYKVLKRGNKSFYEVNNLYKIEEFLTLQVHLEKFLKYKEQKEKQGWNFTKILMGWLIPIWYFIFVGFLCSNIIMIGNPYLLKYLIDWFLNKNAKTSDGLYLFMGLALIAFIKPFFQQHGMRSGYRVLISVNLILFGLYFQKLHKLRLNVKKYINIGRIVNSLGVDIMRIGFVGFTGHQVIVSPILIIIYTILLGFVIKWVTLVGFGITLMAGILQVYIGSFTDKIFKIKSQWADQRSKQVSNAIVGIKQIKFSAWEKVIQKILSQIRSQERGLILTNVLVRAIIDGILFLLPMINSLVCIIIYQKAYKELTLGETFFVLNMFNLAATPLRVFFFSIISIIGAKVSIERIENIFTYPDEGTEDAPNYNNNDVALGEIIFNSACFSHENKELKEKFLKSSGENKKETKPIQIQNVLHNINLHIKQGEFIGIIGKVGCGKSSLLQSLMGVLFQTDGETKKNGNFGYIPQNAFLMNASLKNNILFGLEENTDKYNHVIKICQLQPDIEMLPAKDQTEIGERGINLSGGQKQRISIARIVYSNPDILLIDDSLSALDTHVGKFIFNDVFKDHFKNKTRILVTHALQYINELDKIIYMENGMILEMGTYKELLDKSESFREFVNQKTKEQKETEEENEQQESKDQISERKSSLKQNSIKKKDSKVDDKGILTKQEKRFKGTIDLNIYTKYFAKGNWFYFIFVMSLLAISVGIRIFIDYWIGAWISDKYGLSENSYINIYIILACICLVFIIARGYFFGHYMALICFRIFREFIDQLLLKKMSYFDTTPSGQIQNLVTQDTDYMDLQLPGTIYAALAIFFQLIGTFVIVGISNIYVIPVLVILIILFTYSIIIYLKTSMELRRLEQIQFSPIITTLSEYFNGLEIYRSLNQFSFVKTKYINDVNTLCKISYHDRMCQAYINMVTELLIASLITIVTLIFVFGKIYSWDIIISNISLVSVSLNWILILPLSINFFMFSFAEWNKGMSSIQRIFLNISEGEIEKSHEMPLPPKFWPENGKINATNVDIRYREGLPRVLKNLNFEIQHGEKIGIVGRTGSGKSTLINAITRILEIDNPETGFLYINNVDIGQIGLRHLRSNIQVIPQEPFLIEGSLRDNIDPFKELSDQTIVSSLQKALIWDSNLFEIKKQKEEKNNGVVNGENNHLNSETTIDIMNDEEKLKFHIEGKGANLSNGQKQLICIARALSKIPKILLMDEATSNIDPSTDQQIQKVLKEQFEDSTLITIAHRLDTIMFYDRIFVFDQGEIVENGSPYELLSQKTIFNKMSDQ